MKGKRDEERELEEGKGTFPSFRGRQAADSKESQEGKGRSSA